MEIKTGNFIMHFKTLEVLNNVFYILEPKINLKFHRIFGKEISHVTIESMTIKKIVNLIILLKSFVNLLPIQKI